MLGAEGDVTDAGQELDVPAGRSDDVLKSVAKELTDRTGEAPRPLCRDSGAEALGWCCRLGVTSGCTCAIARPSASRPPHWTMPEVPTTMCASVLPCSMMMPYSRP